MGQLTSSREERILRLTIDRPEKHNALDEGTCQALVQALDGAARDEGVGVILLDAAGGVFCAGVDPDEALVPESRERTELHERLFAFGYGFPKPVVAAVQGGCFGAGVGLVANCHVVLASQSATFGLTQIRVGHWPFVTHRAMALALGERRTVELALTGRIFSTADAVQYGLVHEAVPAFELDDRATATAHLLARSSQETMRRGLEFVQRSRGLGWEAGGRLAAEYSGRTVRSADFAEGVRAALERRKPEWPSLRRG